MRAADRPTRRYPRKPAPSVQTSSRSVRRRLSSRPGQRPSPPPRRQSPIHALCPGQHATPWPLFRRLPSCGHRRPYDSPQLHRRPSLPLTGLLLVRSHAPRRTTYRWSTTRHEQWQTTTLISLGRSFHPLEFDRRCRGPAALAGWPAVPFAPYPPGAAPPPPFCDSPLRLPPPGAISPPQLPVLVLLSLVPRISCISSSN
jgi:hypothetical protein